MRTDLCARVFITVFLQYGRNRNNLNVQQQRKKLSTLHWIHEIVVRAFYKNIFKDYNMKICSHFILLRKKARYKTTYILISINFIIMKKCFLKN